MKLYLPIAVCCALCMLLIGRVLFWYNNWPALREGQVLTTETILLSEPHTNGFKQSFTLLYQGKQKIQVTSGRFPAFRYGDRLLIKGQLKIASFASRGQTVKLYKLDYPEIIQLKPLKLLLPARYVRERVAEAFHASLPQPAASLLMGIVFGINEAMPEHFQTDLQNGGVMHVIAASGMNVTMVAGALFSVLGRVMRRPKAVIISLLGIVSYAVLSGLQPSIVRASVMGCLVFSATLFGRQNTAYLTLFITAFLMLFWRPSYFGDVGFQLSFMATLGILLIKPLCQDFEKRFILLEDVTTTFAAQLATLPIILAIFGNYGLFSLFVNALVLWTIPPLMLIGSVGAVIGLFLKPLSGFILYLALPLLWFFIGIVSWFGRFSVSLRVESFPFYLWVLYYALLLSFIFLLYRRKAMRKTT